MKAEITTLSIHHLQKYLKVVLLRKPENNQLCRTCRIHTAHCLIDIHTSPGHNGDTDNRKSESEENVAYDSDVAMQVTTGNITEQMTNRDELSSDVDIAPSGIVARTNDEYESDEGYLAVAQNSAGCMPNKGNYICNRVITKMI